MRGEKNTLILSLIIAGASVLAGCDNTPGPQRVPVPPADPQQNLKTQPEMRPLPAAQDQSSEAPPPGLYNDPPLISQRPPEQRAFVDAYSRVGRPRIAVVIRSSARSGAPSDLDAAPIDYVLVENVIIDWMRCNGQVTVVDAGVSPTSNDATQRMQAQNADVGILIDAESTKQAMNTASLRMVGSAIDVKSGRIIATAAADVAPPLDKSQVDQSTRYLARKLMDEMTETWNGSAPPAGAGTTAPPIIVPPGNNPNHQSIQGNR